MHCTKPHDGIVTRKPAEIKKAFCFLLRAKMKTNGSHSGHIQVDRQTIETALHDEVAAPPAPPFHVPPSSSTEEALGNEEKAEIMSSGRKQQLPAVHKKKEGNAELESLDSILDNFLITTTSSAVDEQLPSQMDVSNPRSVHFITLSWMVNY